MAKYRRSSVFHPSVKVIGKSDLGIMDKVKSDSEVVDADKDYPKSHLIPATVVVSADAAITVPAASDKNEDLVIRIYVASGATASVNGDSLSSGDNLLRSDGSAWTIYN